MQPAQEQRDRLTRPRHRLREDEHAALAVLDDWELLVTYAVKNGLVCHFPDLIQFIAYIYHLLLDLYV